MYVCVCLVDTHVGDAGAAALATNTTITRLDVSSECVMGNGTCRLHEVMMCVWIVYMTDTQVGDAGATALASNTTITHLSLSSECVSCTTVVFVSYSDVVCMYVFYRFGNLERRCQVHDPSAPT